MIERIDRKEAPPSYRITEAKESRDSQHSAFEQREEMERQQKKESEKEWEKFSSQTVVIRPYKAARERVLKCLYRNSQLRGGTGILRMDIAWKDGNTTRGALIVLKSLDEFMTVKKMKMGDVIPSAVWDRGPVLEFGVPEIIAKSPASSTVMRSEQTQRPAGKKSARQAARRTISVSFGIVNPQTGKPRWGVLLLYILILAFIVAVIII